MEGRVRFSRGDVLALSVFGLIAFIIVVSGLPAPVRFFGRLLFVVGIFLGVFPIRMRMQNGKRFAVLFLGGFGLFVLGLILGST
jgi:uncharacterized membrane protein HdeD (DUF308 family)